MINPDLLESNTNDLLNSQEFQATIEIVTDAFDIEITKIANENIVLSLIDTFESYYKSKDLYTFFIPINLKLLTEDIFTSPNFRDLVLNITDRVSLNLISSIDNTRLLNSIVKAVCINKVRPETESSLMSRELNESLYIKPDVLKELLSNNYWLMVFFILITYFYQTKVYKGLLEKV